MKYVLLSVIRERHSNGKHKEDRRLMERKISFIVPGKPRPLLRAKPVNMGRHASVYDPAENKHARADVKLAAFNAMQKEPDGMLTGPLFANMCFWIPRPDNLRLKNPSRCKPERVLASQFPAKKPDLDNYIKLVLDAIEGIVFQNDSAVCQIFARKPYTNEIPQSVVVISELGERK